MITPSSSTFEGRPPLNARSTLLGALGITFICGLTPYNNYVLNNVDLVSNPLSVGLILFFSLFILLINAPLWRWRPRWAFTDGELAVALSMTLVSSALPSVGFMRALPGHLVAFWGFSAINPERAELMRRLRLPNWIFPTFASTDPAARGNEAIVQNFLNRVPGVHDSFSSRWTAVPWAAWVTPAVTWGIFFAFLVGAVIMLTLLLRRQWLENERLPFPVADVFLSLINKPEPGNALNPLFRSRSFWTAAAAVFVAQSLNALHIYAPAAWPEIPLKFDLRSLLANPPWSFAETNFSVQTISFTIIGITYFIQSRIAFSLWFCYVALQIALMINGSSGQEITPESRTNQAFGALMIIGLSILWVGRGHWVAVARQMFRGRRAGDPVGAYLPYAAVGWGFVAFLTGLVAWLVMAGASLAGAVVLIGMLLLIYIVMIRIVAETGMLYVLIPVPLTQPIQVVGGTVAGGIQSRTTLGSFFWGRFMSAALTADMREALPQYVMNALAIYEPNRTTGDVKRTRPAAYIACLAISLLTAYVVSGASSLYVHYSYTSSIDQAAVTPLEPWGTWQMPSAVTLDPSVRFAQGRRPVESIGNPIAQVSVGAGIASVLSILSLRYAAWPIHPFGYLLAFNWGIQQTWSSLMLGWLCKSLVLRLGGATLYRKSRSAFLGLIFGEMWAIGVWIAVAFIFSYTGTDFHAIHILP